MRRTAARLAEKVNGQGVQADYEGLNQAMVLGIHRTAILSGARDGSGVIPRNGQNWL